MSIPLLLHAIRSGDDDGPPPRVSAAGTSRNNEEAPDDDRIRIERIRGGDERAFLEMYEEFYARLCDFVHPYVGSVALAEDLVGDLVFSIWRDRAVNMEDRSRTDLQGGIVRPTRATSWRASTPRTD